MHLGLAVIVLVFVAGSEAVAQARPESLLRPGVRVRYLVPRASKAFTGVVANADTIGLAVRSDGSEIVVRLGFDSLQSLAVSDGRRSSAEGARLGASIGFRVGLLLGTIATAAVWLSPADERCDGCFISATVGTAQMSVIGTLGLTLLGGALGASAPGEDWTDIPLGASQRRRQ